MRILIMAAEADSELAAEITKRLIASGHEVLNDSAATIQRTETTIVPYHFTKRFEPTVIRDYPIAHKRRYNRGASRPYPNPYRK